MRQRRASSSQAAPVDLVAEADVGHDAELVGAAAQVVADLGLERIRRAPVGVRRERERVERRRDVALAARIGVVAPGAADLLGALDHDEVLDARPACRRIAMPRPENPAPMMATRRRSLSVTAPGESATL